MRMSKFVLCFAIGFVACTCFAQMYSIIDLGPGSNPTDINFKGQVVGNLNGRAFLWTNGNGFQDLGTLPGGTFSRATAINDLGTVTGTADGIGTVHSRLDPSQSILECSNLTQPFIWTPNTGMQGLGTVGVRWWEEVWCDMSFYATDINALSEVVGYSRSYASYQFAFLWSTSAGMNLFGGSWPGTGAAGINNSSVVVGQDNNWALFNGVDGFDRAASYKNGVSTYLPLLSAPDLDPSCNNGAAGINDLGQIVGWSTPFGWKHAVGCFTPENPSHAVLWSQNGDIRDLGPLPGDSQSAASRINFFGQVIGASGKNFLWDTSWYTWWPNLAFAIGGRPFIWSEQSGMMDLNTLIDPGLRWKLTSATGINDWGQVIGEGIVDGQPHGFLLTPIYKTVVQQPINADGSSVFNARRGVIPVKFTLTQNQTPICPVMPATIAITKASGQTLASVDESTYSTNADSGSNFRIEGCQYGYNLAASALGVGTYRVDISMQGIMVGHAVFALK
jgi:probable HAF family extracellular repeat protein